MKEASGHQRKPRLGEKSGLARAHGPEVEAGILVDHSPSVGRSWNLLHTGRGLEAGHPISPGLQPAPVLDPESLPATWGPPCLLWTHRPATRPFPPLSRLLFPHLLSCFRKRHPPHTHMSTSYKHKGPHTDYYSYRLRHHHHIVTVTPHCFLLVT